MLLTLGSSTANIAVKLPLERLAPTKWHHFVRAEAEAPVLLGTAPLRDPLRYLRPFWTGPPEQKTLHLDAPVCGSAGAIQVIWLGSDT